VGSRVELHQPRGGDRAAWCELIRASRRLFSGRVSTAATGSAFAAYLARAEDPSAAYRLIWRREDGALLGAINLSEIVRSKFQSGYLGYYIGAAYAGHGYMTEALQLMLAIAFRRLRLHRVEANIQPGNRASIRLVKRAGFRREGYSPRYLKIAGRWRDHERWALLAEDWRPRIRSLGSRGAST
jgi:[ribosomal protein S5]-alanine N-acetyltransferase